MSRPVARRRAAVRRAGLLLAGLATSALGAHALRAQSSGEGPLVLRLPAATRALAMGNAPLAATDGDAVFANPAMLRTARGATWGVQRWGGAATLGAAANVLEAGPFGLGLGVRYVDWRGDGAWADAVGFGGSRLADGGDSLASSLAVSAGAARRLGPVDVGLGVHLVRETYGALADDGVFVDVGAALPMGPTVLSLSVQHLGAPLRMGDAEGAVPWRAGIGFGGSGLPLSSWFDLGALMQVTIEPGFFRPAGGVELLFVPIEGLVVAGRAGARLPREVDESLATAGLGVTLDRLSLDYAWEPVRGRASSHRLSLRVR